MQSLLNKTQDLLDEIQDLKNCIEMLEYENKQLSKTNYEAFKLIGKYKQYGLDKDLIELEKLK